MRAGTDVWTRMDTSRRTEGCVDDTRSCPGLGIAMPTYGDAQACGRQGEQTWKDTSLQLSAFVSPERAVGKGAGPGSPPPSPAESRGHGLPPPARAAPLRGPSAVSIAAPGSFPLLPFRSAAIRAAAGAGPRDGQPRAAAAAPRGLPRGRRALGYRAVARRSSPRDAPPPRMLRAEARESVCARRTAQ